MTKTQAWVVIQEELMKLTRPEDYDELGIVKFYIRDNLEKHSLQIIYENKLHLDVPYDAEELWTLVE